MDYPQVLLLRIAIIEYGGTLSGVFEKMVFSQVADAQFKKQRSLDVFDCLAYLKKFSQDYDQLVLIAFLERESHEENTAFFDGLAQFEANTGKNVFKLIYYDPEAGPSLVSDLANNFVNFLFFPERLQKEEAAEELASEEKDDFGAPPETESEDLF